MFVLTLVYFALGIGLLMTNVFWMIRFNRMIRRGVPEKLEVFHYPRRGESALRGADPYLKKTLQRLSEQTYPNFDLRLVIDHEEDEAFEAVNEFLQIPARPNTQIRILKKRLGTCSLKVSALLQELTLLEPEYDAVVLIDADAVPYPDWLREMLTPLAEHRTGAVSGLRWYTPDQITPATLYRQIWGSSAMVQMHAFDMAWGGSMAMSRSFLEESDIFDRWSHSLSDDLSINGALRKADMQLRFIPAVLTNHEKAEFAGFFEFIRRQLFMARWHHQNWPGVAAHSFLVLLTTTLGITSLLTALAAGRWDWSAGIIAGSLALCIGYGQAIRWTERTIRRRLARQGEKSPRLNFWYRFAMFPTGFLFLASFLSALTMRRIVWRGVTYEMNDQGHATLLQDEKQAPEAKDKRIQQISIT